MEHPNDQHPQQAKEAAGDSVSEETFAYPGNISQNSPSITNIFVDGKVLGGNLRLEKRLGRGGMGEAWKASDLMAKRDVVVKLVPPEVKNAEQAMEQVRETFQKVHTLQHQHICPVIGLIDDSANGVYVVMKFINGKTLDVYRKEYIAEHGRFSLTRAIEILWDVARALDYSHERKVLHRDVKPQNIMVSPEDGTQLIDFGLAAEIRSTMMQVSEAPMDIAGTRPYMAPEQWRGRLQDAKTDQYALAVTAYELISGHKPFHGEDTIVLRECILREPPEPIEGVSERINAALIKAMAKKREDRFPDCKSFVKALAAGLKKQPDITATVSSPPPPVKAQPAPTVAPTPIPEEPDSWTDIIRDPKILALGGGAAAGVVLLGLLVFALSSSSKPEPNVSEPAAVVKEDVPDKVQAPAPPVVENKPKQPVDDWVSLFDGKTLGDWKPNENPDSFKVQNGCIVGSGARSHLYYMEELENFELRIDAKINNGGNSGVLVKSQWQDAGFPNTGFELQIYNSPQGDPMKTGSLWGIRQIDKPPVGDDEWFTYHIICKGSTLECRINGKTLYVYDDKQGSPPPGETITKDNKRIRQKGYIVLQQVAGNPQFKNIFIKKLPASPPLTGGRMPPAPSGSFTPTEQAEIDKFVAEFGKDVKAKDDKGETLLHKAARQGKIAAVKHLISQGAEVNAKTRFADKYGSGQTPLIFASDMEIVKYLVSQGADVNARTDSDGTPLWGAAYRNQIEKVKYLISKGADINAGDDRGLTPLWIAAADGKREMVECLVSLGADVHVKSNNIAGDAYHSNKTPLEVAKLNKHPAIVEYLESVNQRAGDSATGKTTEQSEIGFEKIFDERSLSGWEGDTNVWRVNQNEKTLINTGRGNLFTTKQYDNFVIRLEFRCENGANNGLMIRVDDNARKDISGKVMEIQIADDRTQQNNNHNGSVYNALSGPKPTTKHGDWNSLEAIVDGQKITTFVNGAKVVEGTIPPDKPFSNVGKGRIGFMGFGGTTALRNIRIKPIASQQVGGEMLKNGNFANGYDIKSVSLKPATGGASARESSQTTQR